MGYKDRNREPVEFYHFTIKNGDYDGEVMGTNVTYTVKGNILNVFHDGKSLLQNRRCSAGDRFDLRVDGDDIRVVGENCVTQMLPQVPVSKPCVSYRSNFYNAVSESVNDLDMEIEIVNESVEDDVYNFKTETMISRSIRKQLIKVCKLEEKVAKAEANGDKNAKGLMKDLVFERKKLNGMKKLLKPDEKADFDKLEKFTIKACKAEMSRASKEKETKESTVVESCIEEHEVHENDDTTTSVEESAFFMEISKETGLTIEESQALWNECVEEDKTYIEGLYGNISKIINDSNKKKVDELTKDKNRAELMKKHYEKKYKETGNVTDKNRAEGYRNMSKRIGQKRSDILGKVRQHHDDVIDRSKKRVVNSQRKRDDMEAIANMFATEAAEMEDEIKPIVEKLNSKGYKVKYASPGHLHLRKKEDREPDGVYYNKLYSDARVMFDDDYGLSGMKAPKNWKWRDVDNCDYLDAIDYPYDEKDGTPDEVFKKFKDDAMASLKEFVDSLPKKGEKKEESVEPIDFNESVESIISEIE